MSNPAPGEMREAHLAGRIYDTSPPSCPGCTRQGSLSLLRPGRTSAVAGLQDRPDLWCCVKCGWEGWGTQLTERLDIDVQVQQCWSEQEHMRVKRGGGSAKGRRTPKPGDNELTKRPEQDPPGPLRQRTSQVEKRSVVRTFRFTPAAMGFLEREAAARCCPVQALVDEAMAEWAERHFCVEL